MLSLYELNTMLTNDSLANDKALKEYKEAKAYYHGHQLATQELEKLARRGQIPIYENIYKMICDKILGYKIQSLQEIKVSGRQEQDKPLANLLNDLLRVFNSQKDYEKEIYKRDFDLLMGQSVIELWVNKDKQGDFHISLKALNNESFLVDTYSVDKNALDSNRFHKKQNLSYLEARLLLGENVDIFQNGSTIVDNRVDIIETWIREYDEEVEEKFSWNRYLWHTIGGIYKYEKRPFKNNTHPFIIARYNIDEKHNWYGLFRDIKPIQDYINFAEIKMGNMLGTIKALYELDAVEDIDEFVEGVSQDNAVVGVRSGALQENKIQFVQHHADIAALSQKSEQKKNMAKILSGLNDEALAMATNRQSGIAIAQRRESGLLGLQYYVNSADNADRLLYEKVLSFIQHYFTKPQMFKMTDKKKVERYFSINTDESNKIEIGHFDLDFKSQLKQQGREERFAHWSEIFKTISSIRPDIVTSLLPLMLKDTDSQIIEDIEEVLANADKAQEEQNKAQQPISQKMQELEMAKLQAQIEKLQKESQKLESQSEVMGQMQEQMKQEANNPQESGKQSDAQKMAKKTMQISVKDMR
nr:hypothetical protein [uncultured Helicobacter sp.]